MRLKAWYSGGRTFELPLEDFSLLPQEGALWFTVFGDAYRYHVKGGDWYYVSQGTLKHVPSGAWGTWAPRPPIECLSCVKKGQGVSLQEWRDVEAVARGTYG